MWPLFCETRKTDEGTSSKAKKKPDAAFSDARKAVIDRMLAMTLVVKVPSNLRLHKLLDWSSLGGAAEVQALQHRDRGADIPVWHSRPDPHEGRTACY